MTYGRIVCNVSEHKAEKNQTRLTVGGDRINYPDDCGTPTADLLTVKLLLNSVIFTKNSKFMTLDIKNFYLNTPLTRYEYLRHRLDNFPEDVIAQYNLKDIVTSDGYVYIEVQKGMYGLPQAGLLAQELLEKRLKKTRLQTKQAHTGFLDPRVKTNLLLPSSGRFWRQVRWRRQCEASDQGTRRAL